MNKLLLFILFFINCSIIHSETISVCSFRLLESDLTANTAGTMEKDQNGETAALIKVVTTQIGFSFDCGSMGIVKTVQKPSEIWVYVPHGVKKMTISHPQLGLLRDYNLLIPIESGRTYEMVIITGTVETFVKKTRTSQYVVFQLTPVNAVVELNGEMLETTEGSVIKMMKFGTYDYRVQAPNYLPEAGKISVSDPNNKHIVYINLKPNYSQVTFNVENNAEIWINGEKKGKGSWSGILGAGTYEVETKKQGHRSEIQTVDIYVTKEPQSFLLQPPTPIYGEMDVNSNIALADIYIDDSLYGKTPQVISNLLIGEHKIKITKSDYNIYTSNVEIKENEVINVYANLDKSTNTSLFNVGNVQFKMVYVEGGKYKMSDVYDAKVLSFYIGETEVTQSLWQEVMGNNPSDLSAGIADNCPVNSISWEDCQTFIAKLNQLTGHKFRLPTESEWEFAARGGIKSLGYIYSGSNNIYDVAWYNVQRLEYVKNKKPNELGIYDMSGNVWEWCQDWHNYYPNEKVYRGGSFNSVLNHLRVTFRNHANIRYSIPMIGFRLALSLGE